MKTYITGVLIIVMKCKCGESFCQLSDLCKSSNRQAVCFVR